jgi:hypothetical protein
VKLENIIEALKPKDAKGYDDIPIKVLKWCAPFNISLMNYIFNKSTGVPRGGVWWVHPPPPPQKNYSEVLTKPSQIPSFMVNTS